MSLKSLPCVGLKDPHKSSVACGTVQSQHVVGPLHIPPSSGALQPHMTDAVVGSLDAPTPDGITALAGSVVVQPPFTLRQRVSRLVRETLSLSKKLANHIGAIKYFICH